MRIAPSILWFHWLNLRADTELRALFLQAILTFAIGAHLTASIFGVIVIDIVWYVCNLTIERLSIRLLHCNGSSFEIEGKVAKVFSCLYLRWLLTRFVRPLTALKVWALSRTIYAHFPFFVFSCLLSEVILPYLINLYQFKLSINHLMITLRDVDGLIWLYIVLYWGLLWLFYHFNGELSFLWRSIISSTFNEISKRITLTVIHSDLLWSLGEREARKTNLFWKIYHLVNSLKSSKEKGIGETHVLYDSILLNLASECPISGIPISFLMNKRVTGSF